MGSVQCSNTGLKCQPVWCAQEGRSVAHTLLLNLVHQRKVSPRERILTSLTMGWRTKSHLPIGSPVSLFRNKQSPPCPPASELERRAGQGGGGGANFVLTLYTVKRMLQKDGKRFGLSILSIWNYTTHQNKSTP